MAADANIPLEDFLDRLAKYVNMDSPSLCKEAMDAMSGKLAEEFRQAGARVITHERPGGNLLECRLGTGSRQILMLGHMDTVFPLGEAQRRPFRREGNRVYGPGVADMKCGIVFILEIFKHFSGRLPADWQLCALLNADEEISSRESQDRILQLCRESECCLCMEPARADLITVQRKGILSFQVETFGVPAHSGGSYQVGRSAIQSLCYIITNLYTLRDDSRDLSINIGGIQGGAWKGNIVADHAKCLGEIRYYEEALADEVAEKLRAIGADSGVDGVHSQLTILSRRPAMERLSSSMELFEIARKAGEKYGLALRPGASGGGSDAAFASQAGIPVIDSLTIEGDLLHTADEFGKADTILPRLYTCIDTVQALLDR